jgi:hypothetical protein
VRPVRCATVRGCCSVQFGLSTLYDPLRAPQELPTEIDPSAMRIASAVNPMIRVWTTSLELSENNAESTVS